MLLFFSLKFTTYQTFEILRKHCKLYLFYLHTPSLNYNENTEECLARSCRDDCGSGGGRSVWGGDEEREGSLSITLLMSPDTEPAAVKSAAYTPGAAAT